MHSFEVLPEQNSDVRRQPQHIASVHLLSLGLAKPSFLQRGAQFGVCNLRISVVEDYRELWVLPKQEAVHIAVLHNSLCSMELEDATRLIRHQWPLARIVVIRDGEDFLEDALYDERILPSATSETLFAKVLELTGKLPSRRQADADC